MKPLYLLLIFSGALIISAMFSANVSGEEKAAEEPRKKKLVILTGDDITHACGTHEFEAGGILLKSSIENSVLADSVECVLVHNWPEDTSVFNNTDHTTRQKMTA